MNRKGRQDGGVVVHIRFLVLLQHGFDGHHGGTADQRHQESQVRPNAEGCHPRLLHQNRP